MTDIIQLKKLKTLADFDPKINGLASNSITSLTGYVKGTAESEIQTTDTLNQALGKLAYSVDNRVTKNADLGSPGQYCKVTVDVKGLVTAGHSLEASDIPSLASNKTTAMTDYAIATSKSAIATTDTLNQAIGKLEYKADNPSETTNATITTTWVTGTNFVTQDITVTGIKSTETPIVSVIYDGATKTDVEAQMTEACKIFRITVSDGKITLYATEATTKALNIQIKRV